MESMTAPMRSSGTTMRRIGRLRRDESPVTEVLNGCAARIPASIRIVLPEFPASNVVAGAPSPRRPRPSTRMSMPAGPAPSAVIVTPRPLRHPSVDAQSAPVE